MEFQEYPKALVKGGEWECELVIVEDKKAESAARKKGWKLFGEGMKQESEGSQEDQATGEE